MSWMNEIGTLLQQYKGASASSPPPSAADDFAKVADRAPASALSSGLSAAFRSQSTPSFGEMIAQLFAQSDGAQRSGILEHLIAAAGPAAASAGIPGSQNPLGAAGPSVPQEQAQQLSSEAVRRLAEEAEQRDPSIVERASEFYAQHPTLVKSLGVGALAVIMSHLSQRH
jgi:hypothetical protein